MRWQLRAHASGANDLLVLAALSRRTGVRRQHGPSTTTTDTNEHVGHTTTASRQEGVGIGRQLHWLKRLWLLLL